MSSAQRPRRQAQKPARYRDSPPQEASQTEISAQIVGKKRKFQALQPIAIEIEAVLTLNYPLPTYVPPFETIYRTGEGNCRDSTELKTFQKFITDAIISLIVAITNAYAARQRENLRTTRDTRK
jgi:hypothetical protein